MRTELQGTQGLMLHLLAIETGSQVPLKVLTKTQVV